MAGSPGDLGQEDLLKEIAELRKSNERLEKAFVAISMLLENQNRTIQHIQGARQPRSSPKDSLQNEFERKLKKSRPGIIKEKVLTHISSTDSCELSELKFLFVDQLEYTTKPSFYRYMKELESEGKILKTHVNSSVYVSAAHKAPAARDYA